MLYTSLEREGALAEVSFHWSQLTPPPSKPVALHRIAVRVNGVLQLTESDLVELGVERSRLATINYDRTQAIGAAAAFLGNNGLIVPSARWQCDNLILFTNDNDLDRSLEVLGTESIEWQSWAKKFGFLS